MTRRRKRERFSPLEKDKSFLFTHIFNTSRQLKEQYHNTSAYQKFTLFPRCYLCILGLRLAEQKNFEELRSMLIIDNTDSDEDFSPGNAEGTNAILFERDGGAQLIEAGFKAVKNIGGQQNRFIR